MPPALAVSSGYYQPPRASLARLGAIAGQLDQARRVNHRFSHGGDAIFVLPGGALYFEGPLELDTDGSSYHTQDPTGQADTSLHDRNDRPIDANRVPYFVLPCKGFCQQFGIRLGDVAAVIYKSRVAYALFADCGPTRKLGEGSIALHRALGHETVRGGKLLNEGLDSGVVTIVFPGSGDTAPARPDSPLTPAQAARLGRSLFRALGGNPG